MKNQTNKNYKFRQPSKSNYNSPKYVNHHDSESSGNVGEGAFKHAIKFRDKYLLMAKEAYASGDRVAAENYYQHADHYERTIMAAKAQKPNVPVVKTTTAPIIEKDEPKEQVVPSELPLNLDENPVQEQIRKPRFRKSYPAKPQE